MENKMENKQTPFGEIRGRIGNCVDRVRVVRNEIKQSVNSLAGSEPEKDANEDRAETPRNVLGGLEALLGVLEIEIGHLEHQTNRLGKLF